MKIPNKKVEGNRPWNDPNPRFWVKIAVLMLKWHVSAEILDISRNYKVENRKKLRK